MSDDITDFVNVRYMVDDVDTAIDFYTKHLGFTLRMSAAPGVRRRRPWQPPPVAERAVQLGGSADAGRHQAGPGRMEPHPFHRE